jgi:hypothetical protein
MNDFRSPMAGSALQTHSHAMNDHPRAVADSAKPTFGLGHTLLIIPLGLVVLIGYILEQTEPQTKSFVESPAITPAYPSKRHGIDS